MLRSPSRSVLAGLLAVLVLLPAAGAYFIDPLPYRFDPVTAVAETGGYALAGHEGGLTLGVDHQAGRNRWTFPGAPGTGVTDATAIGSRFLVGSSSGDGLKGNLSLVESASGALVWTVGQASGVTAIDAFQDVVLVGHQNGRVQRLITTSGASQWTLDLAGPIGDVALRSGQAAAAASGRIHLIDPSTGASLSSVEANARRLTYAGADLVAVMGDGSLRRYSTADGTLQAATVPAGLPTTNLTAVASGFGRVVLGDANSFLYTLNTDLSIAVPPIETYTHRVNRLHLMAADKALVASYGGWLGVVPLKDQPVVLIMRPLQGSVVPNPLVFEWAYQHPSAAPGATVDHAIQVRVEGESAWRTVATGSSSVGPLTKTRRADVDLSAFASGTRLQARVVLTDQAGRTGEDFVLNSFVVDHDPPFLFREPQPPRGSIACRGPSTDCQPTNRPVVLVAHRDNTSLVEPPLTKFWFDGSSAGVLLDAGRSFTSASPNYNMTEGRHVWRIEVRDSAGNYLWYEGNFIVDTRGPTVLNAKVDTVASRLAALSFETDEPARCIVKTGDGTSTAPETDLGGFHSVVLDQLAASTTYTATADCKDAAGRPTRSQLPGFTTKSGASPPTMTFVWSPNLPTGRNDWYTSAQPVRLDVQTSPSDAVVYWSSGSSVFRPLTGPVTFANGTYDVRFFAVKGDGASSEVTNFTVRHDASAPPRPTLYYSTTLNALSWTIGDDPESGTWQYEVEVRTRANPQAFNPLVQLPHPYARFEGVTPDVTEARVVAVNHAGLRGESAPLAVSSGGDVLYTLANVANRTVQQPQELRINFRLAQGAIFQNAILTDKNGVDHPFSSVRTMGVSVFQAYAQSRNFAPGDYVASIRVTAGGATQVVPAGNVTITPPAPATTTSGGPHETVTGTTPGLEAGVLLFALGVGVALRRRR